MAQKEPEKAAIREIIDIPHIKDQIASESFNWDSTCALVKGVADVIQRVQAPKRDEETKAMSAVVQATMRDAQPQEHPEVLCKSLEFLLDRLNVVRIDTANARCVFVSCSRS